MIGDEVARATSVVRYAPGSAFSPHVHTGGEEFLVLDGVFLDEHGDYGLGAYVRNPPGTRHTPGSGPGCTILVKLWQFDLDDRTTVRHRTAPVFEVGDDPAIRTQVLHRDDVEWVRLERWSAGARIDRCDAGGLELFVLEGAFVSGDEPFAARSWLRIPPGQRFSAQVGEGGATVWIKTGHLLDARRRFEAAMARARP